MSLHHLRTFCLLVEEGSFTKTAEKIYLSQPSVSQHIAALEKEYDIALFNRKGRSLSLTPEGNALYTLALEVLQKTDSIPNRLKEMQALRFGKLALGVSTYVGTHILPPLIARFQSQYPEIAITVLTGSDLELHEMLRKGIIEIALLEGNIRMINGKDLKVFTITQDHINLVATPSHPWAHRHTIPPSDINQGQLILYEKECSLFPFVQEYLVEQRIDQYRGIFVNSREVARALAKIGVGIAFINRGSVIEDLKNGSLISLPVKGLEKKCISVLCLYRHSTGLGFAGWAFRRIVEKNISVPSEEENDQ
ncbi:MAG: hypothetical protein CSA35_00650 [Dethiosulfovibrio peptidovorans]|nr:MAG: hypothetical protein CSA35_00650 [Dethiosulfovibrio peptidovorans]